MLVSKLVINLNQLIENVDQYSAFIVCGLIGFKVSNYIQQKRSVVTNIRLAREKDNVSIFF